MLARRVWSLLLSSSVVVPLSSSIVIELVSRCCYPLLSVTVTIIHGVVVVVELLSIVVVWS
jgi:hypothetical protein